MSLFYFFGGDGTDRAGLGGGCIPRRCPLHPPAHPGRLRRTGSRAGSARCNADHATHRHTRPDARHATQVCTLYQTDHAWQIRTTAGLGCIRSVSETVQIWTQRNGSKKYLICEYICCTRNAKPLYNVSKV